MNRTEKINKKEIREVNGILEEIELIDIWRKLNRNKKEYTFFSAVHGTFTKIDHVVEHRNMAKMQKNINNKCKFIRSKCNKNIY